MPEKDPYFAKIWDEYRRETAPYLALLAFMVLLHYGALLFSYFVRDEELDGGGLTVGILVVGTVLLVLGGGFAIATIRAKDSRLAMWRAVGLLTAGVVLPIASLNQLLDL